MIKTANLPTWIDIDTAAIILGINKLHVQLLGRDGKLKLMNSSETIKVETSSVMCRLKEIRESRETFALHAAHPGKLIARASSSIDV